MVMDREIMKELAKHLSLYSEYKKHSLELEEEILNNNKVGYEEHITAKYKVSRKVEDDAIKLMTDPELLYYKNWIDAIDWLIKEIIDEPMKVKLLKYKYLDKLIKVKDVEVMSNLALDGYMSEDDGKFYRKIKEQILYKFEQQARRLNLLN